MVNIQVHALHIHAVRGPINIPVMGTIWNESKTECEVFRLKPTTGHMEYSVPTFITFHDASEVARADFATLLRDMASMAESIVLGIEAKTAKALEARERTTH